MDASYDLARHRADHATNLQPVSIIAPAADDKSGKVVERKATWADVKVGDIVRVKVNRATSHTLFGDVVEVVNRSPLGPHFSMLQASS